MSDDMPRWTAGGLSLWAEPDGPYVLAVDVQAREDALVAEWVNYSIEVRDKAIRQCIAVIEHLHDHEAPHDAHRDALWNAITAISNLLKGDKP